MVELNPQAPMMRELVRRTLERSRCSLNDHARVEEIFELHTAKDFGATFECIRVALEACVYLGRAYLQTSELSDDTVDCSTLSSQAHWLGAAQQIPFIAENQRKAPAGLTVTIDEILPGDVLVKYPDLESTPDGLHNHVAVVLGRDRHGELWVVESSSSSVASLVLAQEFDPRGGIRRFCENPLRAFDDVAAAQALIIAPRVPKQGRVGALRNPIRPEHHFRLPGIDIEVAEGAVVRSPITGVLSIAESKGGHWIEVADDRGWVCRIGNCKSPKRERLPRLIRAGEVIGLAQMNISLPWLEASCLYWQMGRATAVTFGTGRDRPIQSNHEIWQGLRCYNPLYMAKLGLAQLPVQ